MKKLKTLFTLLLIAILVIPFNGVVKAEDEEIDGDPVVVENKKEPVKIYMFRGETCGYCKAAIEWLNSIEDEYGDYFDLVTYEVWNDEKNAELYQQVASFLGDNATGVPYIIVGKYSYPNGFGADSVIDEETGQTMGDQLIQRVLEIYNQDERYDVFEQMNLSIPEEKDHSVAVAIVSIVVIAGFVALIVLAKKNN